MQIRSKEKDQIANSKVVKLSLPKILSMSFFGAHVCIAAFLFLFFLRSSYYFNCCFEILHFSWKPLCCYPNISVSTLNVSVVENGISHQYTLQHKCLVPKTASKDALSHLKKIWEEALQTFTQQWWFVPQLTFSIAVFKHPFPYSLLCIAIFKSKQRRELDHTVCLVHCLKEVLPQVTENICHYISCLHSAYLVLWLVTGK